MAIQEELVSQVNIDYQNSPKDYYQKLSMINHCVKNNNYGMDNYINTIIRCIYQRVQGNIQGVFFLTASPTLTSYR